MVTWVLTASQPRRVTHTQETKGGEAVDKTRKKWSLW